MSPLAGLAVALAAPPANTPWELSTGVGLAVPVEGSGTVEVATLGMATALDPRHVLGLRVALAPGPVPGSGVGAQGLLWAPMVDYRGFFRRGGPLDPFFGAGLGFALADRSATGQDNLAQMVGQLSFGFEAGWEVGPASRLFVAPALGIAPGAFFDGNPFSVAAPLAELRVGLQRLPPER